MQIEDVIERDTTLDAGDKAFLIDTLWMLQGARADREIADDLRLVTERIRTPERLAGVTLQSSLSDDQRARLIRLLSTHVEDLGGRIERLPRAG